MSPKVVPTPTTRNTAVERPALRRLLASKNPGAFEAKNAISPKKTTASRTLPPSSEIRALFTATGSSLPNSLGETAGKTYGGPDLLSEP
jgi:hypothetical protein